MVGKKKKKDKHLGLSLSRIGPSLIPTAIFSAVPTTAQSFSETWPRKTKNLSRLSTALGSVGNIAQAVVVASSPSSREDLCDTPEDSRARFEQIEEYESEGHYAEVDENILKNLSATRTAGNVHLEKQKPGCSGTEKEVIYATVNKRRKPQEEKEEDLAPSNSGSEDDITSVSGMASDDDFDDDESSMAVNHASKSKGNHKKQDSNERKSNKVERISKEIIEEPVTKTDLNENLVSSIDFTDGHDGQLLPSIAIASQSRASRHKIHRNYNSAADFEQEQFNESNLDSYSDIEAPHWVNTKREEALLGASASDLVDDECPEVPPIGDRETPIGKGLSSENITLMKEHEHNLELLATRHEALYKDQLQKMEEAQQRKLYEQQAIVEKHLSELAAGKLKSSLGLEDASHMVKEKKNLVKSEKSTGNSGTNSIECHSTQHETGQLSSSSDRRSMCPRGKGFSPPTISTQQLKKHEATKEQQMPQTLAGSESRKREKKKEMTQKTFSEVADHVQNRHSVSTSEDHTDDIISENKIGQSKNVGETKTTKKRRKKTPKNKDEIDREVKKQTEESQIVQQMSLTLAKETCCKLQQQVRVLDQEKVALESLSQSLIDENKTLRNLAQSLTKNKDMSSGFPVGLLQHQIEELKEENDFLKNSVHRLNVELSRYQANFRPLLPQEVDTMFKFDHSEPSWLVNKKFLAPLLLAYDDRIKEKQDIIKACEEKLRGFEERVGEIVQENAKLHESLYKSQESSRDKEEWRQLEEQAKLVLEENTILMERQEMQNTKLENLTACYKEEVSRLSQQNTNCESEKNILESKIEVMKTTVNELKQKLETFSSEWKKYIPLEEHLNTLNECRRKLEELKEKAQQETDSLNFKLEAAQKENKKLTLQLADYKLANVQMEKEVHNFYETQRKNERRTVLLKERLGHIQEREASAQDTLSEVLNVAERTSLERDALNKMLASKKLENIKIQSLVKREEDKLKDCRNKACNKIAVIKERVKEQERATEKLKERYEDEIKILKNLIRRQQKQLEDMVSDKRNLENELNAIHQKVRVDGGTKNHVT